jgi:hypothetical protein
MKVNVVRDSKGKVVATFENPVGDGPSVKPVLKPGHTAHEVEAEQNYTDDIPAFYERHSR